MNIKTLILSLILCANAPLLAMAPAPGTVIDPIKHTGQFTVSIAEQTFGSSGISHVAKAGTDMFKNKGIPVIITTAASMCPWWALTTGTGYLIVSQCAISDPAILATMAAGASYAVGEQTDSVMKKYFSNPYIKNAAQAALCASCVGLSYATTNPFITEALVATAQAIGLQTILETSACFLKSTQSSINKEQPKCAQAWYSLSAETKASLLESTAHALGTIMPSLCISNSCDPNAMLRILLYEQAYRLAQCGCAAAQHFVNK